jgi:hypothetical protein
MLTGVDTERGSMGDPCPYCEGHVAASGNFCLDCGQSMPAGVVMRHRLLPETERRVGPAGGEGTKTHERGLLRRWLSRRR